MIAKPYIFMSMSIDDSLTLSERAVTSIWTIRGMATLAAAAALLLASCSQDSGSRVRGDAGVLEHASAPEALSLPSACSQCLLETCVEPNTATCPYSTCIKDATCRTALAAFANCYRATRSLQACEREIQVVKGLGPSASTLLLDGFLLDCFSAGCDEI